MNKMMMIIIVLKRYLNFAKEQKGLENIKVID